MDIQEKNAALFQKLLKVSNLEPRTLPFYVRLEADGYLPLSVDRLTHFAAKGPIRIALAHNKKLNGDNMADPDMEFIYDDEHTPRLIAQHYQNDFAGVYSPAPVEYKQAGYNPRHPQQHDLDSFASMWLRNLLDQGHAVKSAGDDGN